MFAISLIVSAKQYVGNPIDCIHTKDIPEVRVRETLSALHAKYADCRYVIAVKIKLLILLNWDICITGSRES